MRIQRLGVFGLVLTFLATMLALAAPAQATVSCGQVITVSTTLTTDVGPCAGDGVVIGAANVTLNLNSHRILGATGTENAGVRIIAADATVQGPGDITGFDAGVANTTAFNNSRVQDLRLFGNGTTSTADLGDGVHIAGGSGHQVLRNAIFDNGPYSGVTLLGGVTNSVIEGNTIYSNARENTPGFNEDDGVRLEVVGTSAPTFITIRNNTIRSSGLDGISMFARSSDNLIVGNTIQANGLHNKTHRKGDGIRVFAGGARNRILDNLVYSNAANGIFIQGPVGSFAGSSTNEIRRNRSLQNNALRVGAFDLVDGNTSPPCDANVWQGNQYRTFNQVCVTAP